MSANGRLKDSELAAIPGGRLRKDAANAWNAMCDEARRRGLGVPMPDGPDSSYRTYDRQVYWRDYWCGRGDCSNAAVPGTSNHGRGIAVDCSHANASAHRATVDQIGGKYGWGPKGSDAPWEEWHMKWQVTIIQRIVYLFLPLHVGIKGKQRASSGPHVFGLSKRLQTCGYIKSRTSKYTYELEAAVKAFQKRHHLAVDGIVGPFTWEAVKAAADVCSRNHKPEV